MLDIAIALTANKFKRTFDKGGSPYILHCLHVMNEVAPDPILMTAGVMHDILEDTDLTRKDLYDMGFDSEVIDIVHCLTHQEGESYKNYIEKVATNHKAVKIKLADLRHNSDITRLKGLTKRDFDRLQKYAEAYTYLSQV